MGSDKARLKLEGRSFVELIASALSAISPSIKLVGATGGTNGERAELSNVPDIRPGWGALGGLHTALAACTATWAAVVACDLPFVSRDLFRHMARLREGFDAVVPVQSDGRQQPLCALYRTELCLPVAAKLIAAGERKPRALLAAVKTRWVPQAELDHLPGAVNFFMNVNSPADYARALRAAGSDPQ
ncbi:MAG: molybdopterin-guanine dinucleotide biosynthesis protein [Blastocatellia bacterium]|jgi:molybdopterin-guanine dinucleotide biosynthesis protein A|nr:molybdopterin-guanine dinucleotide biosynthesis protein [Blastocatellia bacterium]